VQRVFPWGKRKENTNANAKSERFEINESQRYWKTLSV
jgi:hypothetical protein